MTQHGYVVDNRIAVVLRGQLETRQSGGIPHGTREYDEAIERVRARLAADKGRSDGKRGAAKRWEREG